MKATGLALLLFSAIGIGYLVYPQFEARRADDPTGRVARAWAESAELDCNHITDVDAVDTIIAGLRPMSFTCYTDTDVWTIANVDCPILEPVFSRGPPKNEGDYFRPGSVVCWISRTSASGN
jgi:hypothetical protein